MVCQLHTCGMAVLEPCMAGFMCLTKSYMSKLLMYSKKRLGLIQACSGQLFPMACAALQC